MYSNLTTRTFFPVLLSVIDKALKFDPYSCAPILNLYYGPP